MITDQIEVAAATAEFPMASVEPASGVATEFVPTLTVNNDATGANPGAPSQGASDTSTEIVPPPGGVSSQGVLPGPPASTSEAPHGNSGAWTALTTLSWQSASECARREGFILVKIPI